MKNLNAYIKSLVSILTLLGFLGLAACAKKSGNGASRLQNRGTGANFVNNTGINNPGINNPGTGQYQTQCSGTSTQAGRLIDDGSLFGTFRTNYMEFVGVELGDLDGSPNSTSTGVDLQLRIKLNGQNVIAEQSAIRIIVYDSEAAELGALDVSFDRATQANVNPSTGEFTLTFQDNYGQLHVQGRNAGNQVQGRVSFQNSGMGQAKSLGAFTLSTCGVFY